MGCGKASNGQFNVMRKILSNIGDVNFINKYFTDIAMEARYDRHEVTKYLFNDFALELAKVKFTEDSEVKLKLAGVRKNWQVLQ